MTCAEGTVELEVIDVIEETATNRKQYILKIKTLRRRKTAIYLSL